MSFLFHQLLHNTNLDHYSRYAADYSLTLMMVEITQQAIYELYKDRPLNTDYRFVEVLEWIRININTPLTVTEIAERFNYNSDYLSDLIHRKTGLPLMKYIHKAKIAKSKEMLLKTQTSIKQIAYNLGFHDDKYFMKLFKKYEDITPTEYRNAFFMTHMNNR